MSKPGLILRAASAYRRRAAKWFGRRPFTMPPGRAIVSFTFDDFPRSALTRGGAILDQHGLAGTYYTSLGIAGQTTVCGEMYTLDDIPPLLEAGHELGCHTYEHWPAWETEPDDFEASVRRNAQALQDVAPGAKFHSLSYPISYPRPETKQRVGRRFASCRGGGQTFNIGVVDLNYLSAFFLERSLDDPDAIKRCLAENQRAGGWLIVVTHDVSETPTRFGCSPDYFEQTVRFAIETGAEILPVGKAMQTIDARAAANAVESSTARGASR